MKLIKLRLTKKISSRNIEFTGKYIQYIWCIYAICAAIWYGALLTASLASLFAGKKPQTFAETFLYRWNGAVATDSCPRQALNTITVLASTLCDNTCWQMAYICFGFGLSPYPSFEQQRLGNIQLAEKFHYDKKWAIKRYICCMIVTRENNTEKSE